MGGHPDATPGHLAMGLEDIVGWLRKCHLKLNPTKTEVLRLSWGDSGLGFQPPTLDRAPLRSTQTIRSLGVVLDTSICMEVQITNISKLVFYHLHQSRQLAPFFSCLDLATVIYTMVISILDYCNSFYADLPLKLIQKLQVVQNAAVWVLTGMTES